MNWEVSAFPLSWSKDNSSKDKLVYTFVFKAEWEYPQWVPFVGDSVKAAQASPRCTYATTASLPQQCISLTQSPHWMLRREKAEWAVITLIAAGYNPKTVGREEGETLDVTVACSNCKTQKELLKQNSDM